MTSKRSLTTNTRILPLIAALTVLIALATGTRAVAQDTVLYSFGNNGVEPYAGLTFDASGNLYGTTVSGSVFELTPKAGGGWTEAVLYTFNAPGEADLYAGVILDTAGNLYGTEYFGGAYGWGFVFELTPTKAGNWTENTLHSFNPNGTDGVSPVAGLVFDAAGNLYGTTQGGGAYGVGTVFELTPSTGGSWDEMILHNFIDNGTDGYQPNASLIFNASGSLYGTTPTGGIYGADYYSSGTMFELTPSGDGNWTETVLYNFGQSSSGPSDPGAVLVFDPAGNLYSMTRGGGTYNGSGTVFELTSQAGGGWTEATLHSFGNGSDGVNPSAGLILDASGNLYGTTWQGGTYGHGTVFELVPEAGEAWTEKILYSFTGTGTDGKNPSSGLVFDAAGNLYGTTQGGGAYGGGTVFEVNPRLILTTTTLVSSLNPSLVGQAVTFTATVSSTAGTPPNGETITFNNGTSTLGTAPLSGGIASLTTSSLPAGIFIITAGYGGDATFAASASPGLQQAVNTATKFGTATTLASGFNPSIYGEPITWTASVMTSGSMTPTGRINFEWNGETIGTATLNSSGVAMLTRSTLSADTYPLVAVYSGDSNNAGSASPILNQVIMEATSSATLTSSPNPSAQGQAVTFTAIIDALTVSPTGPVTFTAGNTVLGTVQLKGRVAKFTTSTLAVGSTTVTATYAGDSNITGSSASVRQTVQQ